MMLRTLLTLSLVLISFAASAKTAPAAPPPPPQTLAVLDFSFTPHEEELAVTAADALNAELMASKAFTIVERRKIAHAIKEQALGQAGIISEESAMKVGQMVGAKLLVLGRLSKLDDFYRLDARIIDSESTKIVVARHAEFRDKKSLQVAVREVAAGLADPSSGPQAVGSTKDGREAPKDVPVDPGKAKEAARELAEQVGEEFSTVRAKITNVDEGGVATFSYGSKLVFVGMRLDVIGEDEMSGGKTKKGMMIVRRADGSDAWGSVESASAPLDSGDEVVSLPFAPSVTGPSQEAVKAVSKALESLNGFTSTQNKRGTPLRAELDLKGTTIGERHLVLRIIDPHNDVQGTFESTVGL